MSVLHPERPPLRHLVLGRGTGDRILADETGRLALAQAADASPFTPAQTEALRGRSVLVATKAQRPAILCMLALDGLAARMLLGPPDLHAEHLHAGHLHALLAEAAVDAIVTDDSALAAASSLPTVHYAGAPHRHGPAPAGGVDTQWVLFTSGTTGRPKLVCHTLASLTGHVTAGPPSPPGVVWSTFYDVRRYGGLAILVRALLGPASIVLSAAEEGVGPFLARAGAAGVTHISGTPSHWRRALMSPAITALAPRTIRLSGEIADQALLDRLRTAFPAAQVTHAFASTEAGVAFEVLDRLAGFPASLLEARGAASELRVEDGTLRIRSERAASGYLGSPPAARASFVGTGFVDTSFVDTGFVDTGDTVERRGDRFHFTGRREGVINVGGDKVYPEEVEAVIDQHPAVRMSLAWPRPSPVTGAVVAADLVLEPAHPAPFATVRDEVWALCRAALPAHKVPVSLRAVPSLAIAPSGKLSRSRA